MKVYPFKIPKPLHDSLVYQVDYGDVFYNKLHQHEDIQLSFIVEGEGTLVVGDSIHQFKKNDIIVIGSNLPHVFKSQLNKGKKSHMLTLFFDKNSFGNDFFELEELRELSAFFKRAEHGFKITSSKKTMMLLFMQLEKATKLSRFLILLELLKHFEHDISLETISGIANMTKNAFCKYFKKRTNKTYVRFLNELRIEHASKLLMDKKEASIADIAYECGFRNISNFNRQFKMIKVMPPNNFKKKNL